MPTEGAAPAQRRIDSHVHIFPPERTAKLMRWHRRTFHDHPVPDDIDGAGIIADLERHGVEGFFTSAYPLAPEESEPLNLHTAEIMADVRGAVGFGSVHADHRDPAALARTAVGPLGLLGLKLHPFVQRFPVSDERLDGAYAVLAERGRPLLVHTGFDAFYGSRLPPDDLMALALRFPAMPIVAVHLFYPDLIGGLALMAACPNVWADLTNVPGAIRLAAPGGTPPGGTEHAELLRRELPRFSDRLLFGSDHPVGLGSLAQIHADLDALDLPEGVLEAMIWSNARRLVEQHMPGRWE